MINVKYLFILLILITSQVLAQDPPPPPDPCTTAPACYDVGEARACSSKPCCANLDDESGVCKDNSMVDPELSAKSCGMVPVPPQNTTYVLDHAGCTTRFGRGFACLEADYDNMFDNDLTQNPEHNDRERHELEGQLNAEPKAAGERCDTNRDCESRSCVGGPRAKSCAPKGRVCRQASLGETAPSVPHFIGCEPPLEKNSSGICVGRIRNLMEEFGDNEEGSDATSRIQDVELDPTNNCSWELDARSRQRSLIAMKSIRAMEWLFASTSLGNDQDCLGLGQEMKKIGQVFFTKRKKYLNFFNVEMQKLERDFATANAAQKGSQRVLDIHGAPINEHLLATRLTSGYDALFLMYRRNLLFQEYEKWMDILVKDTFRELLFLSDPWVPQKFDEATNAWISENDTWYDKSTRWKLGKLMPLRSKSDFPRCRGLRWGVSKIKDRFDHYYVVMAGQENNKSIIEKAPAYPAKGTALPEAISVSQALNMIWGLKTPQNRPMGADTKGMTKEHAIYNFTHSPLSARMPPERDYKIPDPMDFQVYYLMDPILPGGAEVKFENFGERTLWERVFGTNHRRKRLTGRSDASVKASFKDIHQALDGKLNAYNKTLKRPEAELKALFDQWDDKKFIYEPEIISMVARGCEDDNPQAPLARCQDYHNLMKEITDITFAQVLAYGGHFRKSYKDFFKDNRTWRRRLFHHYETQLMNLSKYYKEVAIHREAQNRCVGLVIDKIVKDETADKENMGNTAGNTEGASTPPVTPSGSAAEQRANLASRQGLNNNYFGAGGNNSSGASTGGRSSAMQSITPEQRMRYTPNLGGGNNRANATSSNLDSIGTHDSINGQGQVQSRSSAIMAARIRDLGRHQAKISDKLGDKSSDNLSAAAAPLSKENAKLAVGAAASASGLSNNNQAAANHGDIKASDQNAAEVNAAGDGMTIGTGIAHGGGKASHGAGGPHGAQNFSGVDMGSSASDAGPNGYRDLSGMSKTEKDVMMATLERNRSKYDPNEDDTLFSKLSKAYVRNLEKILVRKKIEE